MNGERVIVIGKSKHKAIDSDELICIETTNPEDKTILKQAYERIESLHDRLFTLTFPNKNDRPC